MLKVSPLSVTLAEVMEIALNLSCVGVSSGDKGASGAEGIGELVSSICWYGGGKIGNEVKGFDCLTRNLL